MAGTKNRERPKPGATLEDGSKAVFTRSQDDVVLGGRVFGGPQDERLPVVCLAGLTRNSADFSELGQFLSRHSKRPRQVFAFDYRGRGLSDHADPNTYSPLQEARDVLAQVDANGVHEAVVLGTSRGGILAMILGSMRPALLSGVVLNDIGPVLNGQGLARIKNYIGQLTDIGSWKEAETVVKRIAGRGFPAVSDELLPTLARRIFREDGARIIPDFDTKLVQQLEGIDFEDGIPELWPQFESLSRVPVLAIRGGTSDILMPETVREMGTRHPDFRTITVPGQGHAPLLMDDKTNKEIEAFVTRAEARRAGSVISERRRKARDGDVRAA